MNSLRWTLVGLVAVAVFGATPVFGAVDELPDDPKLLKAMVRMYKSSQATKDAKIAKLIQENARLSSEITKLKEDIVRLTPPTATSDLMKPIKPYTGKDLKLPEVKQLPYEIVEKKDISYAGRRRMVYRAVLKVKGKPSEPEIKEAAARIWKHGNQTWDEFTIFFYLPEMDTNSMAYGIAEFGRSGMLKLKVSDFLEASDGSAAESRIKKIFYENVEAQDKMGTQAGDQYIMKKYGLTANELIKIKVEGVKKNWPMP